MTVGRGRRVLASCCAVLLSACRSSSPSASGTGDDAAGADFGVIDSASDSDSPDTLDGGAIDAVSADGGWIAVSAAQPCVIREATAAALKSGLLAPRAWASCGAGCDATRAAQHGYVGAFWGNAASTRSGQSYFVGISSGKPGSYLDEVISLDDLSTVAAFEYSPSGDCDRSEWVDAFVQVFVSAATKRAIIGRISAPGDDVAWNANWFPWSGPSVFDFRWEGGVGVALSSGTVLTTAQTSDANWNVLWSGVGAQEHDIVGDGDLVVWTMPTGGSSSWIRAYSSTKGAQLLLDGTPYFVEALALSESRLAWIAATGPVDGPFTSVRLLWSPRAHDASELSPSTGILIPANSNVNRLRTGGDFAATVGGFGNSAEVHVVNFSSGKVWSLKPRSGHRWLRVLAVTPQYVIVGDQATTDNVQLLGDVVRLRVDALDSLQQSLSGP